MTQHAAPPTDQDLKQRHRAMWALGDYPAVAAEVIPELGPLVVRAAGIRAGQRVLDLAAGSGNAAIPAARLGADVVAADLTPELLEAGRREAARHGLSIDWREADAEALPFADGEFDAVLSTVGVMFAPHHRSAASELTRVTRPGGTIALANWTPEGFVGRMFAAMRPFVPAPPPGVQPPPLWGDEAHVRDLLGSAVQDLVSERHTVLVDRFRTAEAFRDYFASRYGPTVAAYRVNAADPDRTAQLDEALVDLARAAQDPGTGAMEWEYLLVTARRV